MSALKEGDTDPTSGEKLAYPHCDCGHRYFDLPLVPESRAMQRRSCNWCRDEDLVNEVQHDGLGHRE